MKNLFKKDGLLDNFFEISKNNTSVRTEMVAGITTFMTMAYILIVNPQYFQQQEWIKEQYLQQQLYQL